MGRRSDTTAWLLLVDVGLLEIAALFFLGDPSGAEAPSFADGSWRAVDLPHDWSIESKPDKDSPGSAGGGFFAGGVGWYRKTFHAHADWKGKRVSGCGLRR
jgi:beta-galactosidase